MVDECGARILLECFLAEFENSFNSATERKQDFCSIRTHNLLIKSPLPLQGLFVPFARVGSSDPVRVLRLFHNKYTGYN